jgi:hypothetical protein
MDYDHGVMLLCHKAERGVSAETSRPLGWAASTMGEA